MYLGGRAKRLHLHGQLWGYAIGASVGCLGGHLLQQSLQATPTALVSPQVDPSNYGAGKREVRALRCANKEISLYMVSSTTRISCDHTQRQAVTMPRA